MWVLWMSNIKSISVYATGYHNMQIRLVDINGYGDMVQLYQLSSIKHQ